MVWPTLGSKTDKERNRTAKDKYYQLTESSEKIASLEYKIANPNLISIMRRPHKDQTRPKPRSSQQLLSSGRKFLVS